jgi:hypothetical protein
MKYVSEASTLILIQRVILKIMTHKHNVGRYGYMCILNSSDYGV